MALVLDAGALVAVERRDRRVLGRLRVAQQGGGPVLTSGAVVAQVWRSGARQANLARVLAGTHVVALDDRVARRIGELLARSGTDDVVDGHVALLVRRGDHLLTSDVPDIRRLLRCRGVDAAVEHV